LIRTIGHLFVGDPDLVGVKFTGDRSAVNIEAWPGSGCEGVRSSHSSR